MVHEAGMDRVPYVVVVGDEEGAPEKLTVRVRKMLKPGKRIREETTFNLG